MYDPTLPLNNAQVVAAVLRSQFTGLKALIDAIASISAATVDSTSTLAPGSPATASVSVTGNTLHFTFEIPQGSAGTQGIPGNDGVPGPQGPPFSTAVVDAVNTLDPGSAATVSVAFDGTNVRFTFGIPRGADGNSGNDGATGAEGPQGPPGPPGEVTSAQLSSAIQSTSANSNSVAELAGAISDPPQQVEVQAIADKLDELILALRRT